MTKNQGVNEKQASDTKWRGRIGDQLIVVKNDRANHMIYKKHFQEIMF